MADAALPVLFGADGLIPVVTTDADSGDVLMVGFMNERALEATRATRLVHFWSRSRQKLWQKGVSSGHVQHVREIRINCDRNSLLIEVEQVGAVCHDGYATCYYRRLEPDNSLTIVRGRQFDPLDIYPPDGRPTGLATQTRRWWTAYEVLRDHDLTAQSSTSRRLHAPRDGITARIVDELAELAGVLDGTHRHTTVTDDLRLEAGQSLYWLACAGIWHGYTWDTVRPDRALDHSDAEPPRAATLARMLRGRATEIGDLGSWPTAAMLHDTIALVGACLRAHDVDPLEVINVDLAELGEKPYLAEFFENG